MPNIFLYFFQTVVICFFLLAQPLLPCFAAGKNVAPAEKIPTNISSERMEYDANGQTVIFTGKVHVKQPDFELWADKMTVHLDKPAQPQREESSVTPEDMQAGSIDRIVAEKNVRMKSGDKEGTCRLATYYAKTDKIVMEGSPRLVDSKQSAITGGMVVHYIGTNRSEVLHSANVIFYAPDNKKERDVPPLNNSSAQEEDIDK